MPGRTVAAPRMSDLQTEHKRGVQCRPFVSRSVHFAFRESNECK
jgi:hypothetical protein